MQVIFVQTDVLDLNTGNECGEEREIEKEREREREGERQNISTKIAKREEKS